MSSSTAMRRHMLSPNASVRATTHAGRHVVAFMAVALTSTALVAVGCSDPVVAPPQAVLTARLTGSPTICTNVTQDWLKVGNFAGGNKPKREAIQTDQQVLGRNARVDCKVVPNGDGFTLDAQVELEGEGSVRITAAKVKPRVNGADVTSSPVIVTFARSDSPASLVGSDCKLNFINAAEPTDIGNLQRDVAIGRAWGLITCDKAEDKSASKDRFCKAEVEVLLENCLTTN
jgi:hypothetical protein